MRQMSGSLPRGKLLRTTPIFHLIRVSEASAQASHMPVIMKGGEFEYLHIVTSIRMLNR